MVEPGGTLVAYEMGLGKTVLTIAAAEQLIEAGEAGGGLIICPASLKRQWARQILTFTGQAAHVRLVEGDRMQRYRAYTEHKSGKVEYLIMNPEQVVNDWDVVRRLPRDFIAVDEATMIKSNAAQRTRKIKRLKAKWRWALTGQPVENRAEEVYSIMEWVDPVVLGPANIFDQTFIVRDHWGKPIRYRNLPLLHKTLKSAMVRKTWEDPDVRDQMPAVTEESILVDFDPAGAKLYRHVLKELEYALADVGVGGTGFDVLAHYDGAASTHGEAMGDVMSRLTVLRMLCDHPELVRRSAAHYAGEGPHTDRTGSLYAWELREAGLLKTTKKSPKLEATVELITEILEANPRNKVVLFSFFKDALDLLKHATRDLTDSALFTGDLSEPERDRQKRRFQTDPKCRLFLSSDAGGYGVDLPQANYLISYDLPWSAGAWKQRNARIIRLSSEFEKVTLISMLMAGSIEERQYDVLVDKARAASAILDGRGADTKGTLSLDRESLLEFIRASTV
jgi:SNF2 family DNA or RNA helicase